MPQKPSPPPHIVQRARQGNDQTPLINTQPLQIALADVNTFSRASGESMHISWKFNLVKLVETGKGSP